jgi:hypothetical protein
MRNVLVLMIYFIVSVYPHFRPRMLITNSKLRDNKLILVGTFEGLFF